MNFIETFGLLQGELDLLHPKDRESFVQDSLQDVARDSTLPSVGLNDAKGSFQRHFRSDLDWLVTLRGAAYLPRVYVSLPRLTTPLLLFETKPGDRSAGEGSPRRDAESSGKRERTEATLLEELRAILTKLLAGGFSLGIGGDQETQDLSS